METYCSKQKPTSIHYRELKDFKNEAFIKDLKTLFSKLPHEEIVPFEALRKSKRSRLKYKKLISKF